MFECFLPFGRIFILPVRQRTLCDQVSSRTAVSNLKIEEASEVFRTSTAARFNRFCLVRVRLAFRAGPLSVVDNDDLFVCRFTKERRFDSEVLLGKGVASEAFFVLVRTHVQHPARDVNRATGTRDWFVCVSSWR